MPETEHDKALDTILRGMAAATRELQISDALEEHADEHRRFAGDHQAHAQRFATACVEKGFITEAEADKALHRADLPHSFPSEAQ